MVFEMEPGVADDGDDELLEEEDEEDDEDEDLDEDEEDETLCAFSSFSMMDSVSSLPSRYEAVSLSILFRRPSIVFIESLSLSTTSFYSRHSRTLPLDPPPSHC